MPQASIINAILLLCSALGTPQVLANSWDDDGYLIVGASYAMVNAKQNLGGELLPKYAMAGHLGAGFFLTSLLSVEGQYLILGSKSQCQSFTRGESVLGKTILQDEETHQAALSFRGWQLGLRISSEHVFRDWQIWGTIGLANLKAKVEHTHVSTRFSLSNIDTPIDATAVLTNKCQFILTTSLGVNYLLSDDYGLQAYTSWYQTSHFKPLSKQGDRHSASLKDTVLLGIGLIYFF